MSAPNALHRGQAVLLRARTGCETPTYAMVIKQDSPSSVRVIVTADSGGRRRGTRYTAPLGHLDARARGQHRKPPDTPRRRGWWGR